MIKKFINRLFGKGQTPGQAQFAVGNGAAAISATPAPGAAPLGARVEVPASQHRINPALLDAHAVRVVTTLQDAGFEAYVVGGAVRDLLVGLRPKDFDVATDATPEQVKSLFRRAFIIGRRFRIVHVVFGRGRENEVIEVSTFRAYLDPAGADPLPGAEKPSKHAMADKSHVVDASGRVLRDNVWGPQIEDAARRDFTVNAMYYDPSSQVVVDYHGGLADARARVLRMIGDAPTRYREDPVRIIRVVRFAAKLGFSLEPRTEKPLRDMLPLLANVPLSRLFDEMVKLLQTGHALASVEQLKRFGLVAPGVAGPFPVLDAALATGGANHAQRQAFVKRALDDTDKRVAQNRSVVPSFMLACLLWHDVQQRWAALRASGLGPMPALQQAVDAVFDARIGDISGRGKLAADMREIWLMQPRFERRTPSAAASLVEQVRFRAGYDFLRLRAECGEVEALGGTALADWWETFHQASPETREDMLQALRTSPGPSRVKRVAGAAPLADASDAADDEDDDTEGGDPDARNDGASDAPKKRRRRRRRPAASGTAGQGESGV